MKILSKLLLALIFGLGALLAADPPKTPQQIRKEAKKKAAAEEAKKAEELAAAQKAEEAKKAEAARIAEEAKKAEAAKKAAVAKPLLDSSNVTKLIDEQIAKKLEEAKILPSGLCTDAEFLRRVCLDITGVIPSATRAKAFLDDKSTDKRAKLIDELLSDPNYGRKQADLWTPKLYPNDSMNKFITKEPFHEWLAAEFNKNTPWDQFVRTIVDANGTVDEHPEVMFYLANRSIDKLTDATTQHFLGVRLGCAQCHNHPFTATKQTEYWGMAAFFGKVVAEKPMNVNKGGDNAKLAVKEGAGPTKARDFFPESGKKVPPKFFDGPQPNLKPGEPYRPELAKWMTAPENQLFARAIVNLTWSQLFGRGIVDPVDDLIEKNKPSHPELLEALAYQFSHDGGFDVKGLIRNICLSQAYQRSAKPTESNGADKELLSHMAIKQFTAEELFDSMNAVLGTAKAAPGKDDKQKRGPQNERDRFVQFYLAGADEVKSTEYEAGIPQALRVMNAKNGPINAAARSLASGLKPAEALEKIFLTTLARPLTPSETQKFTEYVAKAASIGEAYADILWAILNSSEFAMVR